MDLGPVAPLAPRDHRLDLATRLAARGDSPLFLGLGRHHASELLDVGVLQRPVLEVCLDQRQLAQRMRHAQPIARRARLDAVLALQVLQDRHIAEVIPQLHRLRLAKVSRVLGVPGTAPPRRRLHLAVKALPCGRRVNADANPALDTCLIEHRILLVSALVREPHALSLH